MEGGKTSNEEQCSTSPSDRDRISSLPAEVIDRILVKLPIKEASRTSILSSRWRYRWHGMSHLTFGRKLLTQSKNPQQQYSWQKLARIVDHVLLLHTGPIREFSLMAGLPGGPDIDRWLIYLMRTGVSCLTLWFSQGRHRLSSHLFLCDILDKLVLHRCELKLPPSFGGFPTLRSLKLCSVHILDGGLGALITSCPCLEQLVLIGCEGIGHLKIVAPKLVKFFFYGVFDHISFEDTPCLASANIALSRVREPRYDPIQTSSLSQVIGGLQKVKKLFLEENFLQFLVEYYIPESSPLTFKDLNALHLDINFASLGQILVAFCLFRSSPSLQNLTIKAISESNSNSAVIDFWEKQEPLDCSFNQLLTVEFSGIIGARHELRFIKFILAKAPVLRIFKVNINPAGRVIEEAQIFKELLRFQRASIYAQIIYTD